MKQIIQSRRTGKLLVKAIPSPKVRPGHILVRTHASLISPGTERFVIDFAKKSLVGKAKTRPDLVRKITTIAKKEGLLSAYRKVSARLDEPLPLGYSAAGEVIAVGSGLEGKFHVGGRVAIAGAGAANHAEINLVPANLAAPILSEVSSEEACYATVGAIALHAVRNMRASLGDIVAVVGAGLIGLLAVRLLALAGARVISLDYNKTRLRIAQEFGAEACFCPNESELESSIYSLSQGLGCDAILNAAATGSSEPLEIAARIARDRARVVMVGMTGTEFPYREYMEKELNLIVSRSYGPGRYDPIYENQGMRYPEGWVRWTETANLMEILRLMSPNSAQRLDVKRLTTHSFAIDQSNRAYELVTGNQKQHLGVVITYPKEIFSEKNVEPNFSKTKNLVSKNCVVGVIGAGSFVCSVILPRLKKNSKVVCHTISSLRGATADNAKNNFGFLFSEADEEKVLNCPEINSVIIATRHNTHAELTAQALAQGKAVFVEKPLALDLQGINKVINARNNSQAFFQVGFNRRFSPLVAKMMETISNLPGPRVILMRVNAGFIDTTHWVQLEQEGGGRILGEVCHFVDLARYIAQSPILAIQAEATNSSSKLADNLSLQLTFLDGSVGTIIYTSLGNDLVGKELIEVYVSGTIAILEDFKTLTVSTKDRKAITKRTQDKGFDKCIKAFVDAVCSEKLPPIEELELIETSQATIGVLEAIRTGKKILMDNSLKC